MNIPHPKFPFQSEQAHAILSRGASEKVEDIRAHFAERRNREFPDWQEKYEAEVREWLRAQGQKV